MADGTLKVGTITNSAGSGNITIGSGVTLQSNVPAFFAYLSTTTDLSDAVNTKVVCDTEDFDTDNAYDTSTGEFTVPVAGKYCVFFSVFPKTGTNSTFSRGRGQLIRERSGVSDLTFSSAEIDQRDNPGRGANIGSTVTQEFNVGDVIYINVFEDVTSGTPQIIGFNGGAYFTSFGAYRIGA
jgi:hypothetical protein